MPTSYPYIQVPFATSGDKDTIPVQTDPTGAVSWTQGYGPDYQRDLATDPLAKPIERVGMNQLFYAISAIVKGWQDMAVPEWVPAAETGGMQNAYGLGVWVRYNGNIYVSVDATNTDVPGVGSKWVQAPFRMATAGEISAGAGVFPPSVTQVRGLISSFAPTPQDASLTTKGVVQLSSATEDASEEAKAATPYAVARKFNASRNALASTNINTLNTASARGIYWQGDDSLATTTNGYPSGAAAGTLIVSGDLGSGVPMQVYISSSGKMWSRRSPSDPWLSLSDGYATPISAADYNAISANGQYIFTNSAANKPPTFGASWAIHFVSSGNGGTLAFDIATGAMAYRQVLPGGYGSWLTVWNSATFNAPAALSRITALEARQLPLGQSQVWRDLTTSRALNVNYTNTTGRTIMVSVICKSTTSVAPTPTVGLYINGFLIFEAATGDDYGSGTETVFGTVTCAVPAGAQYLVTPTRNTSALVKWWELTT